MCSSCLNNVIVNILLISEILGYKLILNSLFLGRLFGPPDFRQNTLEVFPGSPYLRVIPVNGLVQCEFGPHGSVLLVGFTGGLLGLLSS